MAEPAVMEKMAVTAVNALFKLVKAENQAQPETAAAAETAAKQHTMSMKNYLIANPATAVMAVKPATPDITLLSAMVLRV